jgi:hypothetical protein
MDEIRALSGQNAALGAYVNSLFLYRWVFGTLPEQIPGMISDVVDTNDPEDAAFILEYSANLVKKVLDSGRAIPRAYWNTTREYGFNRVLESYREIHPEYQVNFSTDDKLSRMTEMLDESIRRFDKRVKVFGQDNHALIDDSILALFPSNDPVLAEARRLVMEFRGRFPAETEMKKQKYQEEVRSWDGTTPAPFMPKSFDSDAWIRIRSGTMDAITSRDGDERDRLVLALYVVANSMPTKTAKEFNDNFLVASQTDESGNDVGPFQYFIQALRNYGYVADTFTIDDDGILDPEYRDIRTWTLTCNGCGNKHRTARQEQYESYMANGGICKRCR